MPSADLATPIKEFIVENFLFRNDRDAISDTESLLEGNIIDSRGVLELVMFLETRFGISVNDDEMVPENLDSIAAIAAYVSGKRRSHAA
jgi:acyl carrier protein